MFQRVFKFAGVAIGCLFVGLAILLIIAIKFSTRGCGGTLATGRSVTAESDGWYVKSQFGRDTATISTPGHTIVVAPTQLIVDGSPVATIAATVKAVEVKVRRGDVEFVADGNTVAHYRK